MTHEIKTGAVLVAAGSGERFGRDKQMAELRGKPVFVHALSVLEASPYIFAIATIFSENNIEAAREIIHMEGFQKVQAVLCGGTRRQDSVRVGLEALTQTQGSLDTILIHDGARPFIDEAMIKRGVEAAMNIGAAIAAVPARDTIKIARPAGDTVDTTPDRLRMFVAQTPQVFKTELICRTHAEVTEDVTDDAQMVERLGRQVALFRGSDYNIKITTPEDMTIAEAIYDARFSKGKNSVEWRWGTGLDAHRFTEGGPLRLGGVDVDFAMHLEGHSDGDVLLHSLANAILGGAALGDLGVHFPSTDERWHRADSNVLLRIAAEKAEKAGWQVNGLDATVIAQKPRLAKMLTAFEASIAHTLEIPSESVNVKVTSTDHLGTIGAGEGIAAQSIATMKRCRYSDAST